jgi:hypothetical protein
MFRNTMPEGRLMIRCTTFLTLAACVMAVPGALAQQPDRSARSDMSSGGGSARAREVIFNAIGAPNRAGKLTWPIGLRLLRGADSPRLQLEAQLQLAVEQVTAGGANPQLLDEIGITVEELRQLLLDDRERRSSLTRAEFEEAESFLQKLKRAPKILAASPPSGGSEGAAR